MRKSLLFIAFIILSVSCTLACSVGGNILGGPQTVCTGVAPSTLRVSSYIGSILRWESSVSPFTTWNPIASTATLDMYNPVPLTQTTAFRAIIQNGSCPEAASDSTIITVTVPIKGTVTGPLKSCAGYGSPIDTFIASGYSGTITGWEYASSPFTSWSPLLSSGWTPYTSDTIAIRGDFNTYWSGSPGYVAYRPVQGCVSTDSIVVYYKNPSRATEWMGRTSDWADWGNWCTGKLGSASDYKIVSDAPFSPVLSGYSGSVDTLTVDSGASLYIGPAGELEINEGITKHAYGSITSHATGTVHYSGGLATSVHPGISYGNLKLNVGSIASGGTNRNLTGNTTAKILTTNGTGSRYLITGNNSLTIDSIFAGTGAIYISTNASFPNSRVTVKNLGAASGKTSTTFRLWDCCDRVDVTLTNIGDVDDYTVRVTGPSNTSYSGETPTGSTITSHATSYVWFINEAVAGGSNATISIQHPTFGWAGGTVTGNKSLARWNGTYWEPYGFNTFGFSNPVSNSGITAMGAFIAIDQASTLLPVQMLSAKAFIKNKDVLVHWQTASEFNNDYFEIERSFDNKSFTAIGKVKGAGNSTKIERYAFTDEYAAPLISQHRVVYYRIKQTDFDGKSSFSATLPVTAESDAMFMIDGPVTNPVSGSAKINYTASSDLPVSVKVCDAFGKTVFEQDMPSAKGMNTLDLTVFEGLSSGIYVVTMSQQNIMNTMKLVKQ